VARSIRIEIPGGFYHVMARGNRRGKIFADDDDRRFFLATLAEPWAWGKGWYSHYLDYWSGLVVRASGPG
jgi:putative transposase